MNILTQSEQFSPEQLEKIEAHYEAAYACETCVKNRNGGWVNQFVSVFYQADPSKVPEGGSQWFGLFFRQEFPSESAPTRLFVVNALSAVEEDIAGVVANNGDVIYSHYRHDYRRSPDGSVWIDGGRDYTRWSGSGPMVTLRIVKDKLTIVEDK